MQVNMSVIVTKRLPINNEWIRGKIKIEGKGKKTGLLVLKGKKDVFAAAA